MKNLSILIISSLLLAGLFAYPNPATAQNNYYWDATGPIDSSPGAGGSGNWNTTSGNTLWWVSGVSDSIWANGNIANFAGTDGTATVNTAVTANGITFATTGYTIGGSSALTLGGSPTAITLPSATGTTTISCPVTVSSGLTLSGTSGVVLDLTGSPITVTGSITINSGTLEVGGSAKLSGGTYSGAISDAGTLNYDSSSSQTLAGVVSGAGNLAVNGGGTLSLTKANTYSGGTYINTGSTLTLGTGGTLASAGNITNNGTFNYNNAASFGISGAIAGSGSLSVNPSAAQGSQLTLTGANTFTGKTTISLAGQVIIASDSELGTPPATFTANQLVMNYGFLKASGTFTLNSNRGITFGNSIPGLGGSIQVSPGQTLTIAAPMTGPNGFISGSGEANFGYGTTILTASNTYTGATGISTGTLELGTNGALPYGTALIMAPDDFGGSVFNLNGFNQTIGPLSTTNVFAGTAGTGTPTIELNNGTLTILQTNITTGFNGVITGAGNLVINGNNSGQLILSNADSYTGITTINGGTLDGYGSGSISSSVVINGGTFEMDSANAFDSTTNTLTMGSGVTVNLNYSGSQTIAALYFGAAMQANGYWGAVGNASATYTDSRFTGPGLLYVCNVPNPTITPASTNVCAGMTTNASVPAAPGGSYSWFISNGTIVSGQSSNILTYTAWAYSPVTLNCYVTSVCGQESGGSQNVLVNVINCGNEVETTNVSYSAGSGATISASGAIGANWALNATTNLTAPLPWPTIQTGTVSSSPFTLTDPNATNCPQQFYYLTNTP